MGWAIIVVMALAVGAALWKFGRLPRGTLELLGAALFLGLAGYAWQGSPTLAGSPTPPKTGAKQPDTATAEERAKMFPEVGGDAMVLQAAQNLHDQGLDAYAIATLKAGLNKNPRSADLWVGLGNALVVYADGMMSPAAKLAFDRAGQIQPDHPGPPFFLGLAFAQAGQIDQAEAVWRGLLDRSPADAPWRADVE
ncbi:MAG: tetratricopeptide repeat protein, partial [Sphingomonadaceae bacterium]